MSNNKNTPNQGTNPADRDPKKTGNTTHTETDHSQHDKEKRSTEAGKQKETTDTTEETSMNKEK